MKKILLISLFFSFFLSLKSCKINSSDSEKFNLKNSILPNSNGNLFEVVFVSNDNLWNSKVGELFTKKLQAPISGLPQQEATFKIVQINQTEFSSIFKSHKNILRLLPSDTTFIEKKLNHWAKNQICINIFFQTKSKLIELIESKRDLITRWLLKKNQIRRIQSISENRELKIERKIKKSFGASFLIPKGFKIAFKKDNFVWLRRDYPNLNVISNIWMYKGKYTDKNQLKKTNLISLRDSLSFLYIKGGRPNSFMATEMLYDPDFSVIKKKPYIVEMRGLWTIENDFLGGPFISRVQLSHNKKNIFYTEGFLYSPNEKKRSHIFELEAVVSSFSLY